MARRLRRFAVALAAALLLAAPTGALAGSITGADIEGERTNPIVDLIIVRPIALGCLGVSALAWVPAQALTMAIRPTEWRTPIDLMLKRPYEFVFVDPLGDH